MSKFIPRAERCLLIVWSNGSIVRRISRDNSKNDDTQYGWDSVSTIIIYKLTVSRPCDRSYG